MSKKIKSITVGAFVQNADVAKHHPVVLNNKVDLEVFVRQSRSGGNTMGRILEITFDDDTKTESEQLHKVVLSSFVEHVCLLTRWGHVKLKQWFSYRKALVFKQDTVLQFPRDMMRYLEEDLSW